MSWSWQENEQRAASVQIKLKTQEVPVSSFLSLPTKANEKTFHGYETPFRVANINSMIPMC